ncbi:olfactory receptor 52L1-like [Prionailurus iriomotensis]
MLPSGFHQAEHIPRPCGFHLLVIFTVYSSTMSSSIIYRVAPTASLAMHNSLSALYLLLPCLVNPVIYGAGTKEIRQHLATLFQLCSKRQSY